MDAHARSLLERLNTSASPKFSKPSTPEKSSTPIPKAAEPKPSDTPESPISTPSRRSSHATAGEKDTSASVKDLLNSARQRSRETSAETESATERPQSGESEAKGPSTQLDSSSTPIPAEKPSRPAVNISDGETSANPEEMPTTPNGSHKSSGQSAGAGTLPETHDEPFKAPNGLYIVNDVPSIVTLPSIEAKIPRLQITTDAQGRTFMGEGIEQIANLQRTFSVFDRDAISATTKYIVYALKGMSLIVLCS